MRHPADSARAVSSPGGYSPSVPISVYRELAAELQASKAMLDSLNAQNQQLIRQNQHMRQEIERVVQTAMSLRQFSESAQVSTNPSVVEAVSTPAPKRLEVTRPSSDDVTDAARVAARLRSPEPSLTDELFTEQGEKPFRVEPKTNAAKDMGGWWLTITILLIVITAFGAGFLVVRPLLPGQQD
ncbi:hypothetical protein IQ268_14020 [Oculatella sp. LEGE 06141]|nr:hypothetical protein [Oculatella sp. LEGE 06141]